MNDLDEQRIRNLRTAGWGYKAIAEFCALTRDQVRSYCTTRNLDAAPLVCQPYTGSSSGSVLLARLQA